MQSQHPLYEVMPLFSPQYDSKVYALHSELKRRIKEGNFDEQTNLLAEKLLLTDTSNYNAWYCKKMHILNHPCSIEHQYYFANSCLGEKAKSFQVWQQKRFLMDYHQDAERQLDKSEDVLKKIDHKNYHAWSFRVWLIDREGKHADELPFAAQMIDEDCLNNSAWSYRFFLLEKILEKAPENKKEILDREVEYTLQKISLFKTNKASWNYLRGLFPSIRLSSFASKNSLRASPIQSYEAYPNIIENCMKWWNEIKETTQKLSKDEAISASMIQREILCTLVHIHSQKEQSKQFAINICDQLAVKDKQKAFYWKWVQNNL